MKGGEKKKQPEEKKIQWTQNSAEIRGKFNHYHNNHREVSILHPWNTRKLKKRFQKGEQKQERRNNKFNLKIEKIS